MVHFCATFLKPEMLHVYRQITGCRDFRARVFTWKRENADRFQFEDLTIIPRARTRELRRFWMRKILRKPVQIYRGEALRLERQFREADVLHVYFGHIGVQLLPLLRRRTLPTVVSFHGADAMVDMEKPAYRSATNEVLDLADLLLVRSESLSARLVELGADAKKIRVHRTGIPLGEFPPIQRTPPADGAWHFLQACRLIGKKGLATTLRAFAAFREKFPAARLTIAGEGPAESEMRALAASLGVEPEWTGFLAQDELRSLYGRAHIFVHPSELGADGNQEGVPNSMLEAMATGLPVLATDHGGIPEAVTTGVDGFLVSERDHTALAVAMLRLTRDPVLYDKMSAAAADSVRRKFEQGTQIAVLESCYREAIARRQLISAGKDS